MEHLKYPERFIKHTISAPFIYGAFIWYLTLDLFVEIYHRVCFPLYWLKLINRKKYIKFDRHRLPQLSYLDKFNCLYCSYWNWVINYVKAITAETEKYWCGIKHADDPNFIHPEHHKDFPAYWDKKAFIEKYWNTTKKCKLERT